MGLVVVLRPALAGLCALAVVLLLLAPVRAGGCGLIVTAGGGSPVGVEVGDVVSIEGFNFALGDVLLTFSVDGTELRTETVTAADAFGNTGYFIIDVTPQAGEEGFWEIVATEVEGQCSASDAVPVGAAPAATATAAPVIPDVASASPPSMPPIASLLGGALLLLAGLIVLRRPGISG